MGAVVGRQMLRCCACREAAHFFVVRVPILTGKWTLSFIYWPFSKHSSAEVGCVEAYGFGFLAHVALNAHKVLPAEYMLDVLH